MAPSSPEQRFLDQLHGNPDGFARGYAAKFGNVFNADNAATLFRAYNDSPVTMRAAVHPAASELRDSLFAKRLAEPAAPGKNFVLFTAGGNATGKSTVAQLSGAGDEAHAVYDSTLSDPDGARDLVNRTLDAGKSVRIYHVSRPLDESVAGMIERSATEGRVVGIDQMIGSARNSAEVARTLQQEYANDPRVSVKFFNNAGGVPQETDGPVEPESYDQTRSQMNAIVDADHAAGRISDEVWRRIRSGN